MSLAAAAAAAVPKVENCLQSQGRPACYHAGHAEPAGYAVACWAGVWLPRVCHSSTEPVLLH